MENPWFSVIIPTYNRAYSVTDAIDSVLKQTFSDFELIVVDDGSTDNTAEVVKAIAEKDQRVRYIYQQNAERSAARNKGIELAKGKYLCFLDSDDLFLKNHLYEFHRILVEQGVPIAMLVCGVVYPNSNGYTKAETYVTETNDPMELVIKTAICSQQTCIHREILETYKYDTTIRIGEDQELWIRIIKEYPMVLADHHTVVIRDLGDRTISETNLDSYLANLALKKRLFKEDSEGRIRPEWRRFVLSGIYFKLAKIHLNRNELGRCYVNIIRSMTISPSHYWKDKLLLVASTIPLLNKFIR